MNNKVDINFR